MLFVVWVFVCLFLFWVCFWVVVCFVFFVFWVFFFWGGLVGCGVFLGWVADCWLLLLLCVLFCCVLLLLLVLFELCFEFFFGEVVVLLWYINTYDLRRAN